MSLKCEVTGKKPLTGHNVSHSNRKTKRRFLPNLHNKRVWDEVEGRWRKVRVSLKGLRLIDKIGVQAALARGEELQKG